jgi:formylglycine-generating enzyme required for sulfatase activity
MKKLLAKIAFMIVTVSIARTVEPPAGTTIVHPADGALMVYVPAGEFIMGLNETDAETVAEHLGFESADILWAWEAYPKRTVYVGGFFIDKYEVTVKRWHRYVKVSNNESKARHAVRHYDKPHEQLLPAASIGWEEARSYCSWTVKALPSEAQWEKAARGTDGRLYPWGNTAPTEALAWFGPKGGPTPPSYTHVGSFPDGVSPYGALDMLGNQYEWTSEWGHPYPGNPMADKMRSYAAKNGCLRGGSWYHGWAGYYAAKRFGFLPDETHFHVGFRTVWEPGTGYFESAAFKRDQATVSAREAEIAKLREAAGTQSAEEG